MLFFSIFISKWGWWKLWMQCLPPLSWNTAMVGANHQSINQYSILTLSCSWWFCFLQLKEDLCIMIINFFSCILKSCKKLISEIKINISQELVAFDQSKYSSPPLARPPLHQKWPYKRGSLSREGHFGGNLLPQCIWNLAW